MSMLSYAAGPRFLQWFGAPLLRFYDVYAGIAGDLARKDRRRRELPLTSSMRTNFLAE
jgi:hypothetical protein